MKNYTNIVISNESNHFCVSSVLAEPYVYYMLCLKEAWHELAANDSSCVSRWMLFDTSAYNGRFIVCVFQHAFSIPFVIHLIASLLGEKAVGSCEVGVR